MNHPNFPGPGNEQPKRLLRYTLVHGTFAHAAAWVNQTKGREPPSFRQKLADAAEPHDAVVEISVPKPWGSPYLLPDLSHMARKRGSDQLIEHINQMPDKQPNESHFIVAHSHGGNIGMYALRDDSVSARIDGIICMATPFLGRRRRAIPIATMLLSVLIVAIGFVNHALQKPEIYELENRLSMALRDAGFVIYIFGGALVGSLLIRLMVRLNDPPRKSSLPMPGKMLEEMSFAGINTPTLLIRSCADEASFILRSTQLAIYLASKALGLITKFGWPLAGVTIVLFSWSELTRSNAGLPLRNLLSLTEFLLLAISWSTIAFFSVLLYALVFVGIDSALLGSEVETTIEDGPPGIPANIIVMPFDPQDSKGLAHSKVYQDPNTAYEIVDWSMHISNSS